MLKDAQFNSTHWLKQVTQLQMQATQKTTRQKGKNDILFTSGKTFKFVQLLVILSLKLKLVSPPSNWIVIWPQTCMASEEAFKPIDQVLAENLVVFIFYFLINCLTFKGTALALNLCWADILIIGIILHDLLIAVISYTTKLQIWNWWL